jgi:hypothetical protein
MPQWSAWIMGFFVFGGARYAVGTFLGSSAGEQLISYALSLVAALMIVGLVGRLFVQHK